MTGHPTPSASSYQTLEFLTSWRDEPDQTAVITASFDGGDPVEIMRWESDTNSDFYEGPICDPPTYVEVDFDVPVGAENVVLTFGYTAGNNWWWAIDNIQITGTGDVGILGDYDSSGELDAADLDLQAQAIAGRQNPPEYDLNDDGLVDFQDRLVWVNDLKNTWIGDANLDNQFSSSDLVQAFVRGKYETGDSAGWGDGDWNGDTLFGSSDMVAAFAAGGYEKGQKAAAASAVPEPSTWALALLAALACLGGRRRRV